MESLVAVPLVEESLSGSSALLEELGASASVQECLSGAVSV
jgi:hypothetical protein